MATLALITGGTTLGPFEFDDDETYSAPQSGGRGEPDGRVVSRLESDEPERLTVLVVER